MLIVRIVENLMVRIVEISRTLIVKIVEKGGVSIRPFSCPVTKVYIFADTLPIISHLLKQYKT